MGINVEYKKIEKNRSKNFLVLLESNKAIKLCVHLMNRYTEQSMFFFIFIFGDSSKKNQSNLFLQFISFGKKRGTKKKQETKKKVDHFNEQRQFKIKKKKRKKRKKNKKKKKRQTLKWKKGKSFFLVFSSPRILFEHCSVQSLHTGWSKLSIHLYVCGAFDKASSFYRVIFLLVFLFSFFLSCSIILVGEEKKN